MVANYEETVKMPINEPAMGKRKSQIQACSVHFDQFNQLNNEFIYTNYAVVRALFFF